MRNTLTIGFTTLVFAGLCSAATPYAQHNLVSDIAGMADHTDPCLINPWGVTASPTSPFWISDGGSGLSTVYDGNGNPATLIVQIPGPVSGLPSGTLCGKTSEGPGAPTGIVFNNTTSFVLGAAPATFIFASEKGMITGWNGAAGTTAKSMADRSAVGAVYKGLAIATRSEGPLLYAADFANARIDVFDGNMNLLSLSGAFSDGQIPAGFAPFNIQNLGGSLYVAYAKQDDEHEDDVPGRGNGYVDVYDLNGVLLSRLIAGGSLNSPWGLALAPAGFGDFGGALLVGNFGDGTINAFDAISGLMLGTLQDGKGANIRIPGLWGLMFGNGNSPNPGAATSGGDANTLYFTAGIPGPDSVESHGLFGTLQPAPAVAKNGIVNAASFTPTITPGGFTTIFGSGLAATTRTWNQADFVDGKLPTQLDGVSVTINGKAAFVYFVSPNQLDVIAPADSTTGSVPVVVTNNGVPAASINAESQNTSPAFFATGKYVIATHADGGLVGSPSTIAGATPAKAGETISLYGTGFGATTQPVDGMVVSSPVNLATPPSVMIGGATVTVSFAGRTSAGLDQINVTLPSLPAGSPGMVDLPVIAKAGSGITQVGLSVTVQPTN